MKRQKNGLKMPIRPSNSSTKNLRHSSASQRSTGGKIEEETAMEEGREGEARAARRRRRRRKLCESSQLIRESSFSISLCTETHKHTHLPCQRLDLHKLISLLGIPSPSHRLTWLANDGSFILMQHLQCLQCVSVCARKSVCLMCVYMCTHTRVHIHTHTVYLIRARLSLSTPALPLLQQLAHIVSPLGMTKRREKKRGRRGCSERGGRGEEWE